MARIAALPCPRGSTGEGLGGPGGRVSSGLRAVPRPDTTRTCPGNAEPGTLTTTRRRQGRGGGCHHLDERGCRRDLPVEVLLPLLLLDLQGKTGAQNPLQGTETRAHILQTGAWRDRLGTGGLLGAAGPMEEVGASGPARGAESSPTRAGPTAAATPPPGLLTGWKGLAHQGELPVHRGDQAIHIYIRSMCTYIHTLHHSHVTHTCMDRPAIHTCSALRTTQRTYM